MSGSANHNQAYTGAKIKPAPTEHHLTSEPFDFNKARGDPRSWRFHPSTRAPALSGGSRSGFRPTGLVDGATGLPVGLHRPQEYFSLKERIPYEQVAGQGYFTLVAMEMELDRVAAYREFSGETCVP